MAYQEIPESPQFNSQIRKIETTDLVHADIMNELISKLLENDVFLKAFAEGLAAKVLEHTEKKEIHVTATDKTAWNETYQQSTGYTDQKIAELINGAPETLDTLKEIADAMAENNTVVEALDTAIGKKADAAEFETLQKKYYSMVGNNDISSIGDGTLTGAVSSLNTDMLPTYQVYDCGFTMCRIGHIRIICSDYIDADAVRNTILDYRDRPATFTVVPVAICTGGWGTIFGDARFHTNGKITIAASASVGGAMGSYTDVTKLAFNTVFTAK